MLLPFVPACRLPSPWFQGVQLLPLSWVINTPSLVGVAKRRYDHEGKKKFGFSPMRGVPFVSLSPGEAKVEQEGESFSALSIVLN